ncbi:helix-turn-helix domain-containing protein [Maribacter sp. X9]|uniref:helix-turn-helix domain-containing protein n=1 Tax=Maribacter sp. X9 TaxID=3402159 RepID=UPI003AF3DF9A
MALYEGLKYLPKQSNNKQELQNKWLIILSIATIAMFLNYLLIYFSIIPYYPGDTFLFSIIIVLLTIWVIQNPALLKIVNNKYLNSNLSPEEIEMYSSLLAESLAGKKLYLNQELSLTSLSTFVGITPKQLSQVINQSYNMNYSQLIAKYRIEEAKKMLRAKKYKDYKISAIAYECGFNNLSSFNVSFKRLTKTTAIQYRNS